MTFFEVFQSEDSYTIKVSNLASSKTTEHLEALFAQHCNVHSAVVSFVLILILSFLFLLLLLLPLSLMYC